MIRLVWRGVRFARGRAVALAAGMLVAAVAFSLLTASVEVSAAQVKGVVGANWRGEYDLLVLPRGSVQTGAGKHLVQVNYLSASTSGITMSQYATIARLPGVAVAAPLEIVGYLLETAYIPVVLSPAATGSSGSRVLLVTSRYTADQGLSAYPPYDEGYVYITTDHVTPPPSQEFHGRGAHTVGPAERLPDGKSVIVCPVTFPVPLGQPSPFQRTSGLLDGDCYSRAGGTPGPVEGMVAWSFPVLVAGIDPRAESELTGLGRAVTSGKYLAEGQRPSITPGGPGLIPTDVVPTLASTASFDGDTDHVTVSLLPSPAVTVARSGASQAAMTRAFGSLAGTPVMQTTITGAAAWRRLLTALTPALNAYNSGVTQSVGQYWTSGPVTYRPGPDGQLDPVPASNPVSIWTAGLGVGGDQYVKAPPAAADTGYRALTEMKETFGGGLVGGKVGASVPPYLQIRLAGEFDPERLAGFSGGGAGSPLASYRAPLLTGADAASRAALGNQPLEPDGNMAGYAQQPPLLYTTLAGAAVLENTARYYSGTGTRAAAQLKSTAAAPIGSIRVRVSGLRGTVPEQLDKIGAIGEEIEKATGLQVIITAGASPYPVTIGLPAGTFGRPALQLTEDWTQTDAALLVLHQADRESLALLLLILVVCALFLSGAALAGVRGRRTEIGALRAVGWGRRQVFTIVLGEVVTLGIAAGLAGAGLSAGLISGLGLHLPLSRALLVLPVAAVLATVSGLAPAWVASRIPPAQALMPAARAPRRGGRRVRTVTGLAITGVVRTPGRSAVAAIALAVGVAGLTVLLAAHVSFATSIGDSELADLVNGSTRGTDLVSALLTIALSAGGVADLTYLNLRERSGELAALAAAGWGRRQLGRLLTSEAVLTAGTGSVAGAAIGLTVAGVAFGLTLPLLATAALAAAGGTAATLAAVLTVLLFTSGRPLAAVLAADE
jgi:putative ABC transport system permease protein